MFAFGTQRLLDKGRMQAVCARAYANGFRIFDTALAYGNQGVLGAALKAISAADISVVSKISPSALAGKGSRTCIDRILAELQRHRVDTVLIHSPKNVDHVAAMRYLLGEKDAGRIGKVGVSNYTLRHLEHLAQHGIVPDVLQTEIHPFLQETVLVRHCGANGIEVMGHTAFAYGRVFNDAPLAEFAAEAGMGVAELVLRWTAARGIVPVISTTHEDRVPSPCGAPAGLPSLIMERIAALDAGMRICNDPAWADF